MEANFVVIDRAKDGNLVLWTPYREDWIDRIRKIPGRRWDVPLRKWVIPSTNEAVAQFCHHFRDVPVEVKDPELIGHFPILMQLRNREELESLSRLTDRIRRKGYSRSTELAYVGHAKRFLNQLEVPFDEVTPEHLQQYVRKLMAEGRTHIYISQMLSAMRFWICEVESRAGFHKLWLMPKREKKLPTVLSMREVK